MKKTCKFMMLTSAIMLPALAQAQTPIADRIWSGGPILTMNDAAMRAEAVAEKGGKIIAVGPMASVMAHRGPSTAMIDLKGRTMIPGLVDAHGHMMMGGLQALSANLLGPPDGKVTDIASMQQTLRDWIAANEAVIKRANIIIGFGYDSAMLKERRHPTRDELDVISKDVPLVVVHQSGHMGVLNSKALDYVGYTAATKNPAGGVIHRRAGGSEPAGLIEETAFFPAVAKLVGSVGPEGLKAFTKAGAELWARFGYTTAQEGRAIPATVGVMRQVAAEGGLKIDVAAYADVLVDRDFIRKNASRDYVNRLRVAGAKLTIDGSAPAFTAWRDRPYYKPVGDYPKGYAGYAAVPIEQVREAVDWAYANRIQILTHANGEKASDAYIDALRLAVKKHGIGPDRRNVMIHGQFLREDQVESYRRLRVTPSVFPMHTFYWGDWHRDQTVGPELAENISPTGWIARRGMRFSSHHDAPVVFPDSMRVLDATVTRRTRTGDILGPMQRVDVITALKAMTLWPAWHHHEDKLKGSIEVGKLADLVVLSRDPSSGDLDTIDEIKVVETIKEGQSIYAATEAELKRASLGLQPGPSEQAFMNYVSKATTSYELDSLPLAQRNNPFIRTALQAGAHGASCQSSFITSLVTTMLDQTAPGLR